ncbi:MAG: heme lyase CcmF/NrfE family subunit [Gammaproteobacteria bacterium]|nr:heme lyase CcmF/NrfE family subunit [Gammaproteobacteria bacterium]MDH3906430.1 heme lyase CcmF/NrfE family subunit [Gammaproteobacteria bacterium]MDH3954001.1 heme lyase CcmF/NrfE family subunit [Gammaproteobacteria bacterium]MDH4004499.1 heme lyase CcmF/NrfE family subunit [Gammaproteobacteria bacterium]NCF60962.1 heme lyase CcmF/NrfE family subunit [Gammaproteobacteria bacterium]
MIPEIGHFALILALSLALCQGVIPLVGAHRNDSAMMAVARTAANGHFFFVAFAFGCLVWAFVQSDFSVLYVANHSQLALPTIYKVSAVWGAHEGSLLMWILILAIWTVAVSYFSHDLPQAFSARVIGVLGLLSTGFLLFTLLTSNPFERLTPAPADGADLNPLLQDPGLAIHPPILYAGYVGFSVAFAFAIAAMISGNLDQKWAKWTRPWTTVAWLFLTVGIALGSWWAYYELGWGGWWFWDPVENASFMPWLVGTALIHSLAVTERRGLFKSWTLLLAISAFSLSLLGTFLVRSGILVSVHAFATDPTRGFFILGFLGVVILSALLLYAWRAPGLDSAAGFRPLSRETFLLLNNVLLVIAALLVFIGTLAPLVVEVLNAGKISVGAPWFSVAFAIPMLPLVVLMGMGMHTAWRSQPLEPWLRRLRIPAAVALVIGLVIPFMYGGPFGALAAVGSIAGIWIIVVSLIQPLRTWRSKVRLTPAVLGMSVAHMGVGLFVLGVTMVNTFGVETDRALRPGESIEIGKYQYEMRELRDVRGPNYSAREAVIDIRRNGEFVAEVRPQKRQYLVQKSPMTEAGIDAGLTRDLFVALGDQIGQDTWSVRVQYKPMIRFIWLGCLVMALGGLIAASDRRYRMVAAESPATGKAVPETA